jgi:molecular chaperone HscB
VGIKFTNNLQKIIKIMNNHFQIFDIAPNLDLNSNDLEEKYLELQLQFHPDLFINKSQDKQEKAKISSSNINNAYEILKDP